MTHTPGLSPAEEAAFARAEEASLSALGGVWPNPAVGAVILDAAGHVVGVGATQPPGGPHAEVVALTHAGERARGGTAVVTLEPCNHTGRTGPCAQALLAAGIRRVVIGQPDPTRTAGGGAETLRAHGVQVLTIGRTAAALEPWLHRQATGRPWVTWKVAHTLDGFIAAADGTSQWITGPTARAAGHADRARRDAILVGTGTVLADNPRLSARTPSGALAAHQPEPIVVGTRPIPPHFHLAGVARQFSTLASAMDYLVDAGHTNVLVEGGAGLARSALAAGIVCDIHAYVAPKILGAGTPMIAGMVSPTLSQAQQFEIVDITPLGEDVRLVARAVSAPEAAVRPPAG
ncbi:bifunctional diaminohydroxyphosphoribosylaminopyrimidine deaminase/5-amino-6-(5-phosphoribosylamino)uracil reductase RibD [Corynebacterium sp. 13CS0277]|uniref:bifunctional diaminohydroxyphosphoribosylaminopyrimidine deaminase/5-amino-6-(5-phosphoribosylamino)uracil reductase RibD n=1 Tax=Corynebacterium sp. 13CS0277 TaxID=2071994 RepID=UPI000D022F43|nr:bifunctional diaminohydroxyphosphoribosylaminopyrimidine deaminase/5-amino-6-(5-phosphoribosylamino)uracil reductase RibD [Corynebacterium sp. 13CS0277]PRQ11931.1 bifunctional diaminohydroxyphosphoribosylaminopyrimidine deaminase/5-amino-6-(5-phosphoribosylamino)uracil reductase RibD [Corynebacterium sp. 13CS0277]